VEAGFVFLAVVAGGFDFHALFGGAGVPRLRRKNEELNPKNFYAIIMP
jgi:hypothetical protein